jgi:DNA-binding transcriptional MocR family regulator
MAVAAGAAAVEGAAAMGMTNGDGRRNSHFDQFREQWLRQILVAAPMNTMKSVATAISFHMNRKQGGVAWPSINLLRKKAGVSRSQVIRTTKWLEANGYLRIDRKCSHSNRYFPLLPSAATQPVDGVTHDTRLVSPMTPEPLKGTSEFKKGKKDLDSEGRQEKEKRLGEKVRGKEPSQSAKSKPSFNPFNAVPAPAFPRRNLSDPAETLAAALERLESARRGRLQ